MKIVGLLGELAGYEHGLGWHLPLIERDGRLVAPAMPRWSGDDLDVVSPAREESALKLPEFQIDEGQILLVRGETYRRNQYRLEIATAIDWALQVDGFDIAAGSITQFLDEEQRLRDLAMSRFWAGIIEADGDVCRSALHLLRVNGQLDRLTPVVLRAIMHGRFLDPVGLQRVADLASARVGVEPAELLDKASSLFQTLSVANPGIPAEGLLVELSATLGELSPAVRLHELLQQRALPELVGIVIHEVQKSVRQDSPLRIRASGVRSGQRISTPALALLAHLVRRGDAGKRLLLDQPATPARPALERTGLMELIDPVPIGTQVALAVSHVEVRKSAAAYHVVGFHRPPKKTYDHLMSSDIPRWIRTACASAPVRHRDAMVRAIAQLLRNVRDHASMTRSVESESGVYLSVTQGGGDESTNRLTAVVFDNGGGLRSSLEGECGPLKSKTEDLVRWLFTGDTLPVTADRALLERSVGVGFRELTASVRRVGEFAQEHGEKPARSHLTVITSSRKAGSTELVMADLLAADEPWVSTFTSPTSVTGTTVVFSVPLAPDDAIPSWGDAPFLPGEAASQAESKDAVVERPSG